MSSAIYGEHGGLWGNYLSELGGNLLESRLKLRGDVDSILEQIFKNGVQGEISNRVGDAVND